MTTAAIHEALRSNDRSSSLDSPSAHVELLHAEGIAMIFIFRRPLPTGRSPVIRRQLCFVLVTQVYNIPPKPFTEETRTRVSQVLV